MLDPVCQPHAHWPVCAQPLFLSVNSPLDHSTPSSSSSSSSSLPGPYLVAECQTLGWTPTCYDNQISQATSPFKHKICKRASFIHHLFFSPTFSDRHVTLVSSPADTLPRVPDGLLAWYSCGMGLGCGPGSEGMRVFVFFPFDLFVIENMSCTIILIMHLHNEEGLTAMWGALLLLMKSQCRWAPCVCLCVSVFKHDRKTCGYSVWRRAKVGPPWVKNVMWDVPSLCWVT